MTTRRNPEQHYHPDTAASAAQELQRLVDGHLARALQRANLGLSNEVLEDFVISLGMKWVEEPVRSSVTITFELVSSETPDEIRERLKPAREWLASIGQARNVHTQIVRL